MRLLLTTAAVAALAISGVAVAQQAPTPLNPAPAAPEVTPAPPSSITIPSITTPSVTVTTPSINLGAADSRAVGGFIADQLEAEFLATDLIGKDVMTAADERLGTINDLLIGEDGAIAGAVLGTGGFLGIGEKQVAVDFSELDVAWDSADNRWEIRSGLTLQAIETAPEFVRWTPDAPVGPVGVAPEPVTPMAPVSPAPSMSPAPTPAPAP